METKTVPINRKLTILSRFRSSCFKTDNKKPLKGILEDTPTAKTTRRQIPGKKAANIQQIN
jgi:hypothetical protein